MLTFLINNSKSHAHWGDDMVTLNLLDKQEKI